MKMQMINLASVSRKKSKKNTNNEIIPSKSSQAVNRIDDFNNIVIMSGTARRKSINKKEPCASGIKIVEKNFLKEDFLKLRVPSCKSHHKQVHTENKLMTKSCEILFDCIKSCKDIRVARKTQVTESETIGSIFKTNAVIYERKATRKIQFLSFSEEIPSEFFLWDKRQTYRDYKEAAPFDFNMEQLRVQADINSLIPNKEESGQSKTVSSEDFIINAISGAGGIKLFHNQ